MRRPSPSMIVSIVAVVLAGAGTSIAAVNFAKNAGAVDGKSAVGAFATNAKAAGKLVATGGEGRIPARFLDLANYAAKHKFAQGIEVVDNADSTPVALASIPGLGLISATCKDAAAAGGTEDPEVTVTFANGSGTTASWSRTVGRGAADVTTVAANTTTSFTIAGSNVFDLYAVVGSTHYVMEGVVRQEGRNTAAGGCIVYGYGLVL